MKTKTNRFLSIFMILTILASLLTSLTMTVSAENYPGGLYFYEPWNTTPATQPAGGEIASHDITEYKADGEKHYQKITTKETLSGGDNSVLTITDNEYSTVQINFPESLNGRTTDAFTKEGPNTDLIVEFDLNIDPGDLASAALPFYIVVGDKDFVYTTSAGKDYSMGAGSSNGRRASAAYIGTKVTEDGNLTLSINEKDSTNSTDMGSVSANEWHRYKMVFHLTNDTTALTKWSLYVDGTAIKENAGICKAPSIDCIQLVARGADNTKYTCNIDNLSVYKKNSENQLFSTENLAIAINRVFTYKTTYETDGEGSKQLDDLNTAYDAAVTALNTSYTTAQTDVVAAQTAVDAALANLTEAETALKDWIENRTYPGGVLVYESFTGIVDSTVNDAIKAPTNQPKDTEATTSRKRAGNDSGAGLGDYARQHKDNSTTNFSATIPTAYFAEHTNTALVAAQGPDAKLTLEFDFKFDGDVKTTENILTAVSIGNPDIGVSTTGRGNAAVAVYLTAPNEVRFYKDTASTDYDVYYLPEGISYDQWHRYKLEVNLTDADSKGASTYTFTVDGENVVDAEGAKQTSFTKKLSVTEISKVRIDTTKSGYYTRLDNLSVYKTTETYEALSTAELMTKLHEVNAKMEAYQAAEGTEAWTTFNKAVTAAGEMVTTAFGTYDENGTAVNPVKSQEDVDAVLLELENAENDLIEVLSPYYVSGLITDETTGELTGVTVQEIKEAADATAKMIIATYDENGMVAAQIQAVTAGENTLTSSMDITGKTVKVFIWDMSESTLLDYLADVYTFENVVTE